MIGWIIGITILCLIFLCGFMMWPARPTKAQRSVFARRAYAHRGLFDNETSRPENSLAAFAYAMQKGFGCELDVQFTKDKQLIVFHDADYKRACGVDKKVWELTYDEIETFRLFGTDQKIPLFQEVLDVVAGRQPLIVEIKAEGVGMQWYAQQCAAVLAMLRTYDGAYCVESFHPLVVRWFYKNARDIMRGQLVNGAQRNKHLPKIVSVFIAFLLTNIVNRPHFIAYNEKDRNIALRLAQKLGAMTVVWTVRSQERYDQLKNIEDAIIFDQFIPLSL